MNLDLFNNLLNSVKENNFVQDFVKELTNYLEKADNRLSSQENKIKTNSLKQENCLYQVVEMDTDGAYLYNTSNEIVSKETDIAKEILDKIGNDSVLKYQNGEYLIEEELTQDFFDHLVEIKEYETIQNNFIKESNIVQMDPDTRYKILLKDSDYTIVSYGNDEKNTIKVPNELIPFWAKNGENLYYKNGEFNRDK